MAAVRVPTFAALELHTASSSIYHVLRGHVLNQTLKPGQRLELDELARQFGVSRTPVKDALTRLAAEGLIRIEPRRGTFVAELNVEDIPDTYQVRLALELIAAERLVKSITPEGLATLRQRLRDIDDAGPNQGVETHLQKGYAFHESFVELSGNKMLLEVYRSLNTNIQIARIHYMNPDWHRRLVQEQQEHYTILDTVSARSAVRLSDAIRSHLQRAEDSLARDIVAARDGNGASARDRQRRSTEPRADGKGEHNFRRGR